MSHTRKLRDQNSVLRGLSAISKLAAAQKRAALGRSSLLPESPCREKIQIEKSNSMSIIEVTVPVTGIEDTTKKTPETSAVSFQSKAVATLTAFDRKVTKVLRYAETNDKRMGNLYAHVARLAFEGNATYATLKDILETAESNWKLKKSLPQSWYSAKSAVRKALKYGVSIFKSGEMSPPKGYEDLPIGEFAGLLAPKNTIEDRATKAATKKAGGEVITIDKDFNYVNTLLTRIRKRLEKSSFDDIKTVELGNMIAGLAETLNGKITQFKVNKIEVDPAPAPKLEKAAGE